jgi:hypothetical protein
MRGKVTVTASGLSMKMGILAFIRFSMSSEFTGMMSIGTLSLQSSDHFSTEIKIRPDSDFSNCQQKTKKNKQKNKKQLIHA